MTKVFIAYARADQNAVQKVVRDMTDWDLDVAWDEDLGSGQPWAEELEREIKASDHFVWIMSKHSARSQEVRREYEIAKRSDAMCHFLRIDGVRVSEATPEVQGLHWLPRDRLPKLIRTISTQSIVAESPKESIARVRWFGAALCIFLPLLIWLVDSVVIPKLRTSTEGAWEVSSNPGAESSPPEFVRTVCWVHVLLIVVLLLLQTVPQPTHAWSKDPIAKKTLKQFIRGWAAVWVAWLALYSWLLIALHFEVRADTLDAVADVLNALTALAFYYLFLVLDKPSVETEDKPDRDRLFTNLLVFAGILHVEIGALSALARFGLLTTNQTPVLALALLVAVSMAYFFGRLDSHYLLVRRWMLAPLYLYVAIQVTWAFFDTGMAQSTAPIPYRALMLALGGILKIYLFFLITQMVRDGLLSRYLESVNASPETASRPPRPAPATGPDP